MPTATDPLAFWTLFSPLVRRSREPWMEDPLDGRTLLLLLFGSFHCGGGTAAALATLLFFNAVVWRVLRLLSGTFRLWR